MIVRDRKTKSLYNTFKRCHNYLQSIGYTLFKILYEHHATIKLSRERLKMQCKNIIRFNAFSLNYFVAILVIIFGKGLYEKMLSFCHLFVIIMTMTIIFIAITVSYGNDSGGVIGGDKENNKSNDIHMIETGKEIEKKVEELKQHQKYNIMMQQNEGLSDEELKALIYYTDSWTKCKKMKEWHRKIATEYAKEQKYKKYYFHVTNGIAKMYRVFHFQNKNQPRISRLFHGSTIKLLDQLSQEQLFLKTVWSFSTKFSVAKRFGIGSIWIIDNVYECLYSGYLKGADISWISCFNEGEFIILPTTFYQWTLMSKKAMQENNWIIRSNIPIYITGSYISNTDPLCAHSDTILDIIKPNYEDLKNEMIDCDEYKPVRDWFENDIGFWEKDAIECYDILDEIARMNKKDLDNIEIMKEHHVKRLLRAIKKLKMNLLCAHGIKSKYDVLENDMNDEDEYEPVTDWIVNNGSDTLREIARMDKPKGKDRIRQLLRNNLDEYTSPLATMGTID